MEETTILTRVDALAAHARGLRRHYGARLMALYALRNDPYPDDEPGDVDPEAEMPWDRLYLAAVLKGSTVDFSQEVKVLTELADHINQDLGDRFITTIYPVSEEEVAHGTTYPARAIREEGVQL